MNKTGLALFVATMAVAKQLSAAPAASYSLPFQLRPTAAATAARIDTALAFSEDAATGDPASTLATMLLGSYRVHPNLAPLVRLGIVRNSPPDVATAPGSALSFVNPLLGATVAMKLPHDLRLGLFFGVTAPIGQGGGDSPDPDTAAATKSGIFARSAMDNAMFAVNYMTFIPGAGIAWVAHDLTVQVEITLLELLRVRGSAVDPDETRTNFTSGLHVGYFVVPWLSLGVELRHQRWLSTPAAVEAKDMLRETSTLAVGPRFHFQVGQTWIRPAIAYARGLDDPMSAQAFHIVQIDVPVVF